MFENRYRNRAVLSSRSYGFEFGLLVIRACLPSLPNGILLFYSIGVKPEFFVSGNVLREFGMVFMFFFLHHARFSIFVDDDMGEGRVDGPGGLFEGRFVVVVQVIQAGEGQVVFQEFLDRW